LAFTELLREAISINATSIHSASHNGVTNTGTIDMSLFGRAMFLGDVGTLGSSGTLDAAMYESDFANGAAPNNIIASSSITQITAANKTWTQEINATQMTRRYLFCSTNNNVAASIYSAFGFGCEPRDHPSNSHDTADVTQRLIIATN